MIDKITHGLAACFDARTVGACQLIANDPWLILGLCLGLLFAVLVGRKILTLAITLRALALMPPLSRRLSNWVKSRDYKEDEFLRADGANQTWVERRKQALDRLAAFLQAQHSQSIAWAHALSDSFSDLRFTDANRVPFPFVRVMRE